MYIYFTHCRLLRLILGARHRCLYSVIFSIPNDFAIEGPCLLTLNSPSFIHDHDPNFMKMCPDSPTNIYISICGIVDDIRLRSPIPLPFSIPRSQTIEISQ